MKHEEIPKELLEQIELAFNADPMVISLKNKKEKYIKSGLFREAMQIGQELESAFDKVVYQYMKLSQKEIEKVNLKQINMPVADKEKISSLAIAMFMACDIIESATLDANDILKKYGKDLSFEMFSEFRQLTKLAKTKLKFLNKESKIMQDFSWGDECDDLYDMAKEKATKILKSAKEKEGDI